MLGLLAAAGLFTVLAWWCFDELSTGRVHALYVVLRFHFTYWLFDFVRPWPGAGMYVHFVALFVLALCIAFGFFYRAASQLFAIGFAVLTHRSCMR